MTKLKLTFNPLTWHISKLTQWNKIKRSLWNWNDSYKLKNEDDFLTKINISSILYWVSRKKLFQFLSIQTVINFLIYILLLFFLRIVFLTLLRYYSEFFCSFLPMEFSIFEHKCKDLTSKIDIFEGSISRKLIALDK